MLPVLTPVPPVTLTVALNHFFPYDLFFGLKSQATPNVSLWHRSPRLFNHKHIFAQAKTFSTKLAVARPWKKRTSKTNPWENCQTELRDTHQRAGTSAAQHFVREHWQARLGAAAAGHCPTAPASCSTQTSPPKYGSLRNVPNSHFSLGLLPATATRKKNCRNCHHLPHPHLHLKNTQNASFAYDLVSAEESYPPSCIRIDTKNGNTTIGVSSTTQRRKGDFCNVYGY